MVVKVDGGAKSYVLPLCVNHHMFLEKLDTDWLPKENRLLSATNVILEFYIVSYLLHGTVKVNVAH